MGCMARLQAPGKVVLPEPTRLVRQGTPGPIPHCLCMKNDDYEKLATAIWQGNTQTIAAMVEMDADDLQEVEKALRDKYKVDIALNGDAGNIHAAIAEARAAPQENTRLDKALREANAEDS